MSKADKNRDVSSFVNSRLQQLALGCHEFQFVFNNEQSISFQREMIAEHTPKGTLKITADRPEETKELAFLLGHTVKEATLDENKILSLTFDNHAKITVHADRQPYEAYVIYTKDDVITD